MASSLTENVIRWGKKLERYTDESMILGVIHKLSKVPVSVDLLQETGIGKVVRGLTKRPGKIGEKASTVLHNWRKVVSNAQKTDTPSYDKQSKEKRSHSKETHTNPKYGHESKSSYSKSEQNFSSSNYMNKEESNGESRLFHPDVEIRTKESSKNNLCSHSEKKHKRDSSFGDPHIKSKKQKLEFLEKSSHGNSSEKGKVKRNSNESNKDSHKHGSHDKKYKDGKKSKEVSDKKDSPSTKKSLGKVAPSTDAFTASEALFEDCLSFNDIVPVKRKKSSKNGSHTSSGLKLVSHDENLSVVESKSKSSKHKSSEKKSSSASHSSVKDEPKPKEGSSKKENPQQLPPLVKENPCIASSLPQPQLNYRPLPRNYDCFPVKRKALTNEDAIMFTSSKKEKTVVYSGRRNFLTAVPTLQESCIRILIDHIDAIEYVGGLPYYLLKPVLERCTPEQLLNIEDYNPDLLEDTRELWEIHCKKDFRTLKPEESETWRDLYLRAFEEREKRLKAITKNISASMTKSTTASRSVKLTYVDSYVKPPRDVARKQVKNGTGLPVNHSLKVGPPSKASPRPTAPAINSAAVSNSKSEYVPKNTKPKVAPLMAKTLKSMRQCFRR